MEKMKKINPFIIAFAISLIGSFLIWREDYVSNGGLRSLTETPLSTIGIILFGSVFYYYIYIIFYSIFRKQK
jgi:hypothetical protein